MNQDTKIKISESKKGVIFKHSGQFKKGATPWNKGLKMSKEHRKKLSIIHKNNPTRYWLGKKRPDLDLSNRIMPSGKNHHNWKGGITSVSEKIRKSKAYKQWRSSVFERDNYTCVSCGQRGGELNADHIKPFSLFPDLRFELLNGRTLCVGCHRKTDTYGDLRYYDTVTSKWGCVASNQEA